MSDLWEKDFNGGVLFPSSFDPEADPDGDGWTNTREAAAGTDPFNANPPGGTIHPLLEHYPAVYITGENGPEILTPEIYTLTWPTLVGKQYCLLFSASLEPGSWLPIGPPVTATGTEALAGIPIVQPDGSTPEALFWRVAVDDTGDADGDGLNEYEENQLGTDPYNASSDGTPDAARAADYAGNSGGSNPPGGGTTGGGTGSNSSEDNLYMDFSSKTYAENCDTYKGTYGDPDYYVSQIFEYYQTNAEITPSFDFSNDFIDSTPISVIEGLAHLNYLPFPEIDSGSMLLIAASIAQSGSIPQASFGYDLWTGGNTIEAGGETTSTRFRLSRSSLETYGQSKMYLKVQTSQLTYRVTGIDTIKLTIPPNELHSNDGELVTTDLDTTRYLTSFSISDNRPATGVDNVSNTVENTPGSGYQEYPWIMAPCGGTVQVGGTVFDMTNDANIEIGNQITGPIEITCPGVIVTHAVFPSIGSTNPAQSSFKGIGNATSEQIPVIKIGTDADQISAELPVRVKVMKKRKVKVGIWPTRQTGHVEALIYPSLKAKIVKKLDEIFAFQINAWFEVVYEPYQEEDLADHTETISSDIGGGNPITLTQKITHANGAKEKALIVSHTDTDVDINIYLITTDAYLLPVGNAMVPCRGNSYPSQNPDSGIYKNSAVIRNSGPEDRIAEDIAHEIGHLLVGAGHPDGSDGGPAPFPNLPKAEHKKRLMCSGFISDTNSKLLVKKEWDEAEEWLSKFPDKRNP